MEPRPVAGGGARRGARAGGAAGRSGGTPRGREMGDHGPMAGRRKVRWKLLALLAVLVPGLAGLVLVGIGYAVTEVPKPNESALATATRILHEDRSEMGRVGEQNRIPVRLDAVPEDVQRAVLAGADSSGERA